MVWTEYAPLWLIGGISVLLVIVQRDLGTGTLFVALLAVLVYVSLGRWQALLGAAVGAAAGGLLGWLYIGVVRLRIDAWLNPWVDPSGNAYQIVQSLIAIASGGLFGRGPGFGSPGFVPAAHTDFIFAAIAEEWGMIGAVALIGLIAVMVNRGLRAASRARDPFAVILAAGVSIGFGLQSVLIMGGVVRLLPLTGVTLPFVSYGGSSLLTSLVGLAFLVHVSGGQHSRSEFLPAFKNAQFVMSVAWVGLAAAIGWWGVYRGPTLVERTDNPRRALAETMSPRGEIYDRNGVRLVETRGAQGDYQRVYISPSTAPVIGYDSTVYGQSGIELSMDEYLRGEVGYAPQVELWHQLVNGTPPPGYDVQLTLDSEMQATTAQGLLPWVGAAAVVLNPSSGRVLALMSTPWFNPQTIEQDWESLTSNPQSPLLDRATQGDYQPGTAIMPFVFAWGLESGALTPDQLAVGPDQSVPIDGQQLGCVRELPSGAPATYENALKAGCPSPFYRYGLGLNPDGITGMSRAFGFGIQPAIRIEASAGQVAAPSETSLLGLEAVGQGNVTVSPLQMARAFSALATDGSLPPLRLVEAVRAPGSDWVGVPSQGERTVALSEATAQAVRRALSSSDGQRIEMTGYAISGLGSSQIAWYEGASLSSPTPLLVVVVLENAGPADAQAAGQKLIADLTQTKP